MLIKWAVEHATGGGYPKQAPFIGERVDGGTQAYDPIGFSRQDYADLETAINNLKSEFQAAIIRTYRPWLRIAMQDLYPASDRMWCYRLERAAFELAMVIRMDYLTT